MFLQKHNCKSLIDRSIERAVQKSLTFTLQFFNCVFNLAGFTIAILQKPITESSDPVNIILSAKESLHI